MTESGSAGWSAMDLWSKIEEQKNENERTKKASPKQRREDRAGVENGNCNMNK